ncbi:MAG: CDP-alcohol phosphatidyltransferase family protein [Nitrospinaceae bacterium]
MAQLVLLSESNKQRYLNLIAPLGRFLARSRVDPNTLSVAGLIFSALAGVVFGLGTFFWGGCLTVLAGTCDALDGQVAKETGKNSRFGAFLDSTLDRFGELFIFLGLAWHFSGGKGLYEEGLGELGIFYGPWTVVLIIFALAGSFLVSYTRARAEGLGIACKVGWMQRPERITLLVIGSLLGAIPVMGPGLMVLVLLIIAVMSNATAIQRIIYVKNQLSEDDSSS